MIIRDGIAIGKSCFFDKKGIISVKLPASLREIGSRAFRNCINLERIEFSGSQVNIHQDAFKNCSSLRHIRTEDGREFELSGLDIPEEETVPPLVRQIHCQVLGNFSISGTTLLYYRGSEERVVVPEGITEIGAEAFAGNEAIDRVILPDSVRKIGRGAFSDCLVMQTINFPEGLRAIGTSAFENCVKLIRAVLPDTVTEISPSAFNRCRTLNELHLGSQVRKIGELAFYGCSKLKTVDFPESLKEIGDMAFYRCQALKEIELPASIEILGSNIFTHSGVKSAVIRCNPASCGTDVFSQCERLKKLKIEDGVRHIGDKFTFQCKNLTFVTLPDSLETVGSHVFEGSHFLSEFPAERVVNHILLDGSRLSGDIVLSGEIHAIAGGAFYRNETITSVTFPDTLHWIGPYAFCGCTSLTEIVLPSGITELPDGVFSCCTSLQTISSRTSAGKITKVGNEAFLNCKSLEEFPWLEDCRFIGSRAFSGCSSMTARLNIASRNTMGEKYPAENAADSGGLYIGDLAFYQTPFLEQLKTGAYSAAALKGAAVFCGVLVDGSDLSGEVCIPEGISSIADYAFSGNEKLTSLTFPETVKRIGDFAFSGCKNLASIRFTAPLESLGKGAFEKCITLPEISCLTETVSSRAFAWCLNLKRIHFPVTESVDGEAFCGCKSLTDCCFGSLHTIGKEAFSLCGQLNSFDLTSVETIGERAFSRCDSLKAITVSGRTVIESYGFEDCGRLTSIVINENSENPDFPDCYAFSGCTSLCKITVSGIPYSLKSYQSLFDHRLPEIVRRIYNSAMSCFFIDENMSLTEYRNNGRYLVIPFGVKRIEEEVFKDLNRLEEIDLPVTVELIGPRAFDKTPWLEKKIAAEGENTVILKNIIINASACKGEVTIPSEVKRISGWAFANCIDLTGITFSSDRIVIEDHAFRNCIHLKRITMPDGTEYRLEGLCSLKKSYPAMIEKIIADCYNCFKMSDDGVLIECTGNINRIVLPEGVRAIGCGALKESNLLTAITLTKETERIEKQAFEQCKWLERVVGTENVTEIGPLAFSGCVRLRSIGRLTHLHHLGERAFENCTFLESVVLPEGLEEIPPRAFYRCHELKQVILPSTIKRIGREAFAFCYKLTDLDLPAELEQIEDRAFAWCPAKVEAI